MQGIAGASIVNARRRTLLRGLGALSATMVVNTDSEARRADASDANGALIKPRPPEQGPQGVLSPGAPQAPSVGQPSGSRMRVALIGDIPYSRYEEQRLLGLWQQLRGEVDLVVHLGDIKGGLESCSDELLSRRLSLLQQCPCPLILVLGDNEWTDCNRVLAGEFDPHERLTWLRRRLFSQGASLGATWPPGWSPLRAQFDDDSGGLPENLFWVSSDTGFITLNVPGSNYGLNASGLDDQSLKTLRLANERWLKLGFERASSLHLKALVVALHADLGFERERHPSLLKPGRKGTRADDEDGYADLRRLLIDLSDRWTGDVLLLNGDSHRYRLDRLTARLTRVQCFGSPFNASWIRLERRPEGREAFSIEIRQVDATNVTG